MPRRASWIAATAALALISGCTSSDTDPAAPDSSTATAAACPPGLGDTLHAWGNAGFSGVVTIVHGDTQCSHGVGLRDREASEPMTADTVFAIGSVSKSVTAAGILHLVADGKLSVTTRVGDVISDLTGPIADVTIEQLLTHTSGLTGDAGPDHQPLSRDEAVAAISALPQVFEPGTDFGYTNAGYTLLALVIDELTGNYRHFIADEIMRISGELADAGFWDGEPAARGPRAVGYLDGGRSDVLGQFQGPHWSTSGNGDLAMTVPDLATWASNLFDGSLLPAAQTADLMSPRWEHEAGVDEALGWVRYDQAVFGAQGFASAGGGGDTGHNAVVAIIPDRDTTIAIASNGSGINAEQLMEQLIPALIAGDSLPTPATPSTAPADPAALAALAAAVGTYTFDDGSTIEVDEDGGQLTVAAIGPTAIDSVFSLPERFTADDVNAHEAAVVELLTGEEPIGAEERDGVRASVGELISVVVQGTVADAHELRTYVTVVGSDGRLEIWYSLADDGGVAAAQAPTDPPSATFAAASDDQFVSSDPTGRRADVTLQFGNASVTIDNGATTTTARKDS